MAKKVTKKSAKKTATKTRTVTAKAKKAAKTAKSTKRATSANGEPAKSKRATRAKTPRADAKTVATLTQERIRQRAYEIYRTGRNPSNPTADWFQAEQELRAELGTS